jgi:hypothetical protein
VVSSIDLAVLANLGEAGVDRLGLKRHSIAGVSAAEDPSQENVATRLRVVARLPEPLQWGASVGAYRQALSRDSIVVAEARDRDAVGAGRLVTDNQHLSLPRLVRDMSARHWLSYH